MKIIQGTTPRGSLTNCVFVEDDLGDRHCFSYGQEVAVIRGRNYIEFNGPQYYSRTSCRHKKLFREYYGFERKDYMSKEGARNASSIT